MGDLRSLAKDTVIYGVSSIFGKFLNYLLTPLYTIYMVSETGDYGVMTNIYSIVAMMLVILTFGMETGFFRFANKEDYDARKVYSAAMQVVLFLSGLFLLLSLVFIDGLSSVLGYANNPQYLYMMFIVVALDAFQALPFSYLRYKKKALKFATLKMLFIVLSITLNVIYFVFMGGRDVGIVFLINLICTTIITLALYAEIREFSLKLDIPLIKQLISYSWPMLILGIAGILNQVADKILFPHIYPDPATKDIQLGIYGASSKVAMVMAMFTQAFRFAYEPIVFGKSRDKDNKIVYAQAMKYFIIFSLLAFLGVVLYMDILKYIIGQTYWEGLVVVPIIMIAELFMGIYFNLSFWYKLTDKTIWGAIFSVTACIVVITLNIIFVPKYGYIACAWASLIGYGIAMSLSYVVGQRYYPINYDIKSIAIYGLSALVIYLIASSIRIDNTVIRLSINTVLLLGYVSLLVKRDLPLKDIPIINKLVKRKQ